MTPEKEGEARVVYGDIIDLPHWESPTHPRMGLRERASQFAPYAALVGYGDMVKDEARRNDEGEPVPLPDGWDPSMEFSEEDYE